MKIASLVGHYPLWSERFIERELKGLAQRKHEILVWPSGEPGREARWKDHSGTPLAPESGGKSFSLWRAITALLRCSPAQLRHLPMVARAAGLLPWTPELVYAHFAYLPAIAGHALAEGFGVPLAVSVHARDVWVPSPPGTRALAGAKQIICCNEAALRELGRQLPHIPATLIRHGLPPESFADSSHEQKADSIFAAGRFVPKKGFEYLLTAVAELRGRGKEVTLTIAGEGPLHLTYGKMARELKLSPDCFTILPALDEQKLHTQLDCAAVIVVPSVVGPDGDRDGIPNLLLEAMARSRPVVASMVGGIPEVLEDGVTGWLVEPGKASALAAALDDALTRRDEAGRRGQEAYAFVQKHFNLARSIESLENVLPGS